MAEAFPAQPVQCLEGAGLQRRTGCSMGACGGSGGGGGGEGGGGVGQGQGLTGRAFSPWNAPRENMVIPESSRNLSVGTNTVIPARESCKWSGA